MKDYFNRIGCKSYMKERYIQLGTRVSMPSTRCKSSIKERYIQQGVDLLFAVLGCKSSIKERYIQPYGSVAPAWGDVNHI